MMLDEMLDLKRQKERPLVIVHCGSTSRAREAFEQWRLQDTLDGMIVLTIGANKNDSDLGITTEKAIELDILHLFKIDLADFVRVLNTGRYIGESTKRELEYARRLGKTIIFLEEPVYCSTCQQVLTSTTTFEYDGRVYCPVHLPEYDKHQQW